MRDSYTHQLETLQKEVQVLGHMCTANIGKSLHGIFNQSEDILDELIEDYHAARVKQQEISSLCMQLLLLQQPVAKDLRLISASLKIASDLDRISSHAREMADLGKLIIDQEVFDKDAVQAMGASTIKMVSQAITAYANGDLNLAGHVERKDDKIDDTYARIREELISRMNHEHDNIEHLVNQLMVIKYLERIADHACHIARWTIYIATGDQSE